MVLALSLMTGCSGKESSQAQTISMTRPMLLENISEEYDYKTLVDDDYKLEADLSNAINGKNYNYMSEEWKSVLSENYFVVTKAYNDEFFDLYESNRYAYIPNFVTTDSLLHTFHLYYAYLQKGLETSTLYQNIADFSMNMYEASLKQYDELKGSEWESAASRNVDYYAVALALTGNAPSELSQRAFEEVNLINEASGVFLSPIFTTEENDYMQDYSQFTVRGYYTESQILQQYFKAMMWYGQMTFVQSDDDLNRSALLSMLSLNEVGFTSWDTIYTITSFFAGESDDATYYEYYPVIEQAYGKDVSVSSLMDNDKGWKAYKEATENMPAPQINGMVVMEDQEIEETTKGCRILGQRFTFDASILQQLVYRNVKESSNGDQRMLPSSLDVASALGSEVASDILEESVSIYPNYDDQMEKVQSTLEKTTDQQWASSMYSAWLATLKPLLVTKEEGYPKFMRSEQWARKNLSTFLGSYTELKHESVL